MRNMDSIQIFKEQLKINLVELHKVTEETGKVTKKTQRPHILENTNDDNHAANNRMEIKILKVIEVAKKEAQLTRQKGGDLASGLKANEPSSNPQQNK